MQLFAPLTHEELEDIEAIKRGGDAVAICERNEWAALNTTLQVESLEGLDAAIFYIPVVVLQDGTGWIYQRAHRTDRGCAFARQADLRAAAGIRGMYAHLSKEGVVGAGLGKRLLQSLTDEQRDQLGTVARLSTSASHFAELAATMLGDKLDEVRAPVVPNEE